MARTNAGPPWTLWVVIFLTSGLVLGFAVILGETQIRMHYVTVAATGALVAVILFLLTQFAHPFFGEMSTSPEPLRAAVQVLESQ
jgi:membrane-associated phospholipid phosphatase